MKSSSECDPITLAPFDDPVLASDGYTYSFASLQHAMAADAWHRSPVTYEVLRPEAYPNPLVAQLLGVAAPEGKPRSLYSAHPSTPQDSARTITWCAPLLLSAPETMVRRRFGLPDAPFAVTAQLTRDAAGKDWLMYPPVVAEAEADTVALAKLLGVHAANPWCLGGATVVVLQSTETQSRHGRSLVPSQGAPLGVAGQSTASASASASAQTSLPVQAVLPPLASSTLTTVESWWLQAEAEAGRAPAPK